MIRKLAPAGLVALLALATLSVFWAGLNWPPPLWIVEYGLPGSQGPTGRVARIDGADYIEVPAGYYPVPALAVAGDAATRCLLRIGVGPKPGVYRETSVWRDVGHSFWMPRRMRVWQGEPAAMEDSSITARRLADATGLPFRVADDVETLTVEAVRFGRRDEGRGHTGPYLGFGLVAPVRSFALVFRLTPDQEHLVEPYLMEAE